MEITVDVGFLYVFRIAFTASLKVSYPQRWLAGVSSLNDQWPVYPPHKVTGWRIFLTRCPLWPLWRIFHLKGVSPEAHYWQGPRPHTLIWLSLPGQCTGHHGHGTLALYTTLLLICWLDQLGIAQSVFGTSSVQHHLCIAQYVYGLSYVLYHLCTTQYVYYTICVLHKLCATQSVFGPRYVLHHLCAAPSITSVSVSVNDPVT